MNTKMLLPIILSFFFFSCNTSTQKQTENDLEKMGLKGKVKSYRKTGYSTVEKFGERQKDQIIFFIKTNFNTDGNMTEKKHFNNKGNLENNFIYNYDEKGNLIEIQYFESNADGFFNSTETYDYDEKNLIGEKYFNYKGDLMWSYTYVYNEKGDLIEENRYSSLSRLWSKYIYRYDEEGNLLEKYYYRFYTADQKKTEYQVTYKYDKKGNMIEEENYDGNGILSYKTHFSYDKKKNLIQETNYNSEDLIENKRIYKYDKRGNLIEEFVCHFYAETQEMVCRSKSKTNYKYDKKGNWIEEIEFNKDNKPIKIIEREIEYY